MNITFFHFGALFFGLVAAYNLHSARKYGVNSLPAIIALMMFISFSLFLLMPLQYGLVAFLITIMFALINYNKGYKSTKQR